MTIPKFILLLCLLVGFSMPALAAEISGNPQGKVTLIEFFDYQCPHCRAMINTIDGLIKSNPNLRVVYRVIPVLDPDSVFEARAALAAKYQGKFNNFHQLLMYQEQTPSREEVLSLASQIDLNKTQLLADMEKPAITDAIRENIEMAKGMQVAGVPTILIGPTNGTTKFRFDGEVSYAQLQSAISQIH